MYEGTHEATQWVPRDASGQIIDLHGSVLAGGQWERIYAVINAEADQSRTITSKMGMDKSISTMFGTEITHEVGVTIEGIFSAKTSIKETFQRTTTETWHEETTISDTPSALELASQ